MSIRLTIILFSMLFSIASAENKEQMNSQIDELFLQSLEKYLSKSKDNIDQHVYKEYDRDAWKYNVEKKCFEQGGLSIYMGNNINNQILLRGLWTLNQKKIVVREYLIQNQESGYNIYILKTKYY